MKQTLYASFLLTLVDTICVIHLDDIIIYSTDTSRHHADVETVDRLRQYKLYAGLKKCEFDCTKVTLLGFVTSGVGMEESRIAMITEWPTPNSYPELLSTIYLLAPSCIRSRKLVDAETRYETVAILKRRFP